MVELTIEEPWKKRCIIGIIVLIVGVLALLLPNKTLEVFMIILGVLGLFYGLYSIYVGVRIDNIFGILKGAIIIILGIILLISPFILTEVMMYILAIIFLIVGILQLANMGTASFKQHNDNKILHILIGILLIALGIIMIIYVDSAVSFVMRIVGIFMIVSSILFFYNGMELKKFNTN